MIQLIHRIETEEERAFRRGKLGMAIFFVSLSMLFGGFLVGLFVLRARVAEWRPPGLGGLPWELWISTALLAIGSWQLWLAQRAAAVSRRAEVFPAVRRATYALLAFLVAQAAGWIDLTLHGFAPATRNLYTFSFYALTLLHALHVLGGFFPLYRVWRVARELGYGAAHHAGLSYCAMYWHYLGCVWVAILVSLHALA
ncbi:MAG: heme-copper oxidase subunit III [Planctomycetes bacterium]|nr:heme-copper oxidase subunit III [Planctomycetota bacterium]